MEDFTQFSQTTTPTQNQRNTFLHFFLLVNGTYSIIYIVPFLR